MSKSKLYTGLVNYDTLVKALKEGKISTYKNENARFFNVNIWVNDEKDEYDNDGSIQLQFKKEFKDEKKIYIGNIKEYVYKTQEATADDFNDDEDDDSFPF